MYTYSFLGDICQICHQDSLSQGRSVTGVVCHQDCVSQGWSVIRIVCHRGGLS